MVLILVFREDMLGDKEKCLLLMTEKVLILVFREDMLGEEFVLVIDF